MLIALFGPLSGAHFNPVVSLAMALTGRREWREMGAYTATQFLAAVAGTAAAHAMFKLPLIRASSHAADRPALWLSELWPRAACCWWCRSSPRGRRAVDGGIVDRRRLLVHGIHVIREPGGGGSEIPVGYLRRHRPVDVPVFAVAEVAGMFLALLAEIPVPAGEKLPEASDRGPCRNGEPTAQLGQRQATGLGGRRDFLRHHFHVHAEERAGGPIECSAQRHHAARMLAHARGDVLQPGFLAGGGIEPPPPQRRQVDLGLRRVDARPAMDADPCR